jgi:uncharacterized RDD family membrane protein YckC
MSTDNNHQQAAWQVHPPPPPQAPPQAPPQTQPQLQPQPQEPDPAAQSQWAVPDTRPPSYLPPAAVQACPACGQPAAGEPSCQFCGQVLVLPAGIALSSAGLRLGGFILESVLIVCTLVIGWLIWAFVVFPRGQTPAKQLLHMKCVHLPDGHPAGWWRMFFREFIAKGLIGIIAAFTLFIPYFWLLWDRNRQELWDKLATTLVVNDNEGRLDPGAYAPESWPADRI